MDTTPHDLKLLSAGYYIQGGIVGFYSLIILGYASFLGTLLPEISRSVEQHGHRGIPVGVMSIVSALIGIVALVSIGYTICLFLAGYWMARYRNLTFLYVVAAVTCLAVPYGTVLGIFTFMVMQRGSAQQLFAHHTRISAGL